MVVHDVDDAPSEKPPHRGFVTELVHKIMAVSQMAPLARLVATRSERYPQ
jgi:hypothetical protein